MIRNLEVTSSRLVRSTTLKRLEFQRFRAFILFHEKQFNGGYWGSLRAYGVVQMWYNVVQICYNISTGLRVEILREEEQAFKSPPIPLALFSCKIIRGDGRLLISGVVIASYVLMYRPFSHHWTLDRSLFVGFNRNDVILLHLVERGCCGYTIAEVICAYGSLVAYVCYPQGQR